MALTIQELEIRDTKRLRHIQACCAGVGNAPSRKQFDAIEDILRKRGAVGIDWDKYRNRNNSDNTTSSVSRCPKKMSASNPDEEAMDIGSFRKDTSIDEITRRELVTASKHLQLYHSASRRGKEFNLGLVDTRKLITAKKCAYTGVKLEEEGPNGRTVDRIDSSKGYVKGNVVAITSKANAVKNILLESDTSTYKMTAKEFEAFALSMIKLKG